MGEQSVPRIVEMKPVGHIFSACFGVARIEREFFRHAADGNAEVCAAFFDDFRIT